MHHPHIDPNLGLGRPYGLPLQGGEVAEFPRRTSTVWAVACRIALEFLAVAALVVGLIVFFAHVH